MLDEVQHLPSLLQTLRVLADRPDHPARFLILGSASPEIIRGASETLAGRMEVVDIGGFDLSETGTAASCTACWGWRMSTPFWGTPRLALPGRVSSWNRYSGCSDRRRPTTGPSIREPNWTGS